MGLVRSEPPNAARPLSNTLQVLVDQRWLSVTAVAKGAAVKQPTLHRYIRVRSNPGIPAKLARYFGCSVDALLDGSAVAGAQRAEPRYTAAEVRLVVGKVPVTARRGIHDTIAQCNPTPSANALMASYP